MQCDGRDSEIAATKRELLGEKSEKEEDGEDSSC
jgi:hypothetical protein